MPLRRQGPLPWASGGPLVIYGYSTASGRRGRQEQAVQVLVAQAAVEAFDPGALPGQTGLSSLTGLQERLRQESLATSRELPSRDRAEVRGLVQGLLDEIGDARGAARAATRRSKVG